MLFFSKCDLQMEFSIFVRITDRNDLMNDLIDLEIDSWCLK